MPPAVAAAGPADRILLYAGTYPERLDISKVVKIEAAEPGAIIASTAFEQIAVKAGGDLTLSGAGKSLRISGADRCLRVMGGGKLWLEDVVVRDCTSATGGAGLLVSPSGTATLKNDTFDGNAALGASTDGGHIETSGTLTIVGGVYTNGSAGDDAGALNVLSGTVSITGASFVDNTAADDAGALYQAGGAVTMSGNLFSGNVADRGAHLTATAGTLSDTASTFSNGSAFGGNGLVGDGGALYLAATSAPTFTDSVFTNNYAPKRGGVAFLSGVTATFDGITATDNVGATGGGVFYAVSNATLFVDDATMTNNQATLTGAHGGVGHFSTGADIDMFGGTVSNTTGALSAADDGGAFHLEGGTHSFSTVAFDRVSAFDRGGSLDVLAGTVVTVADCTFDGPTSGSVAQRGGAIWVEGTGAKVNITGSDFTNLVTTGESGAIGIGVNAVVTVGGSSTFTDNGTGGSTGGGGAIGHIPMDGSPALVVKDSTFTGNYSNTDGGAIRYWGATVTLESNTFTDNRAIGGAGGHVWSRGGVTDVGSTFDSGQAKGDGGAIDFAWTMNTATLSGSTFTNNVAGAFGGALAMYTKGRTTVTGVTFTGNRATLDGGAFFHDSEVYSNLLPSLVLTGSTFTGNKARKGGALHLMKLWTGTAADFRIRDNAFSGNTATQSGGGANINDVTGLDLQRNLFCNNSAGTDGGGIYLATSTGVSSQNDVFLENKATGIGGGIRIWNSSSTLVNDHFVGNSANTSGASVAIGSDVATTTEIRNTLMADGVGPQALSVVNSPTTLDYNAWHANTAHASGVALGPNDLDLTVLGLNPNLKAYVRDGVCGDDVRPKYPSPLVDAGDPDAAYKDPDGSRNDIGAYGGGKANPADHVDADGDSYAPFRECDDTKILVYPGAPEAIGDGVDGDCNGKETCYVDADDDTFAAASSNTMLSSDLDCDDPGEGTNAEAAKPDDCDDTLPSVYSGAPEAVDNGRDEDCDSKETCYVDTDNDGFAAPSSSTMLSADLDCNDPGEGTSAEAAKPDDCDDALASVYSGAPEVIDNARDEDCDGKETCYVDTDNDGFASPSSSTMLSADLDCNDPGEGTTAEAAKPDDCDDALASVYSGAPEVIDNARDEDCDAKETCYVDTDNDGFAATSSSTMLSTDLDCNDPGEGTAAEAAKPDDCDDTLASVYSGAPEAIDNGRDEDCDGKETCYVDTDSDGFASNGSSTMLSTDLDCNDPGEGTSAEAAKPDDCDDTLASVYSGAPEAIDNGRDEDCDAKETCYADADDDTFAAASTSTVLSADLDCNDSGEGTVTEAAKPDDCDDTRSSVYSGAPEAIDNGRDEDCDGKETCYVDTDDDGFAAPSSDTMLSADLDCADPGEGTAAEAVKPDDCDDTRATVYFGAPEAIDNGRDEDCDGKETCYVDTDNDGFASNSSDTLLSTDLDCNDPGEGTTAEAAKPDDCDDTLASVYSGAPEAIDNGRDEDCDGKETCYVDTDDDGYAAVNTSTVLSADLDCNDPGEGTTAEAAKPDDCDDTRATVYSGAPESIDNGRDEDCDGKETCYADADNDGFAAASSNTVLSTDLDCNDPGEGTVAEAAKPDDCDDTLASVYSGAPESIDNGRDEDCDGKETCYADADDDGFAAPSSNTVLSTDLDCTDSGEGTTAEAAKTDDCDDTLASVYFGAPEVIDNGRDEDCDGKETCYVDADKDTFVPGSATVLSPDLVCKTSDGEATVASQAKGNDCNDADATIYKGAFEIPGNNVDNDCDGGEICYVDSDKDTWVPGTATVPSVDAVCLTSAGEATATNQAKGDDCDDTVSAIRPGATEGIGDNVDQNCDGVETCYKDGDRDTFVPDAQTVSSTADTLCKTADGEATALLQAKGDDCDDQQPTTYPGASEAPGDQIDSDCDGKERCFLDADRDGYASDDFATVLSPDTYCTTAMGEARVDQLAGPGEHDDCNDADADIHPGADEEVGDGVDSDCDGDEICYLDNDLDGWVADTLPTVVSTDEDCGDPKEAKASQITDFDCNDASFATHPGAIEQCNGLDDDCDGVGDENVTDVPWYRDQDGDTWGDSSDMVMDCASPPGFVNRSGDCAADDPLVFPGAGELPGDEVDQNCDHKEDCYRDQDGDGYLPVGTAIVESQDLVCDGLDGEATSAALAAARDCLDADPLAHPGGIDVPGDAVDQDCDNVLACLLDADQDGFSDDSLGTVGSNDPDCDDPTEAWASDPGGDCRDDLVDVHPGVAEKPGDELDSNCDGLEKCYADADFDGFVAADLTKVTSTDEDCADDGEAPASALAVVNDCNDGEASVHPGALETAGDGVDSDCDEQEWCYDDADDDGYVGADLAKVLSADLACTLPYLLPETALDLPLDCDNAPDGGGIHPDAVEVPGDEFDQNCDLAELCYVDADGDGYVVDTLATLESTSDITCDGPLEAAASQVHGANDCDDAKTSIHADAEETVADGVDQDCDGGDTCYRDQDRDGYGLGPESLVASTDLSCDSPGELSTLDLGVDCDDTEESVHPDAVEVAANDIDENCDGKEICYFDGDDDGSLFPGPVAILSDDSDCADTTEGTAIEALKAADCNDDDELVYPNATETPGDEFDQNCDGADRCYLDRDEDGYVDDKKTELGSLSCDGPYQKLASDRKDEDDCDDDDAGVYPDAKEIWGDEVDQDCDGEEVCYRDGDLDGYRSDGRTESDDAWCDDSGEAPATAELDCDDGDQDVNPLADEIAGDGVDSNCDEIELCYLDLDDDGYVEDTLTPVPTADLSCLEEDFSPASAVLPVNDCDDAKPEVHPDTKAKEEPGDGVDQDCDGWEKCFVDADDDGYGDPLATTDVWVGGDPSCDGSGVSTALLATDCDDGVTTVHPGAPEVVGDELDSDCDGTEICYADVDHDGFGRPEQTLVSDQDVDCRALGELRASDPLTDCDNAESTGGSRYPGAPEVISDGVDQDCDGGDTCYRDGDGDGWAVEPTAGADGWTDALASADLVCGNAPGEVDARDAGLGFDCDDALISVHPGADEGVGDGVDQDCDAMEVCYVDLDGDGWIRADALGRPEVIDSADLDCVDVGEAPEDPGRTQFDCNDDPPEGADIHPGAFDAPYDDVDADCAGDDDFDLDGDGTPLSEDCDDDDTGVFPGADETPEDGVDQDCNGKDALNAGQFGGRRCSCGTGASGYGLAWLWGAALLLRRRSVVRAGLGDRP